MSDIEKETGGFDRELDKSLAIMRYLSGTRIFPKPSSATGTRAQELFRRVLIYTSVVNRFLELRPRDDSSGSARVEENDSEEALTETPGEEAFEGESLLMQFEDSQRILAGLAPEMQKVIIISSLSSGREFFCSSPNLEPVRESGSPPYRLFWCMLKDIRGLKRSKMVF